VNRSVRLLVLLTLVLGLSATMACAQDEPAGPPPQQQGQARAGRDGVRPVFGKITAVHDGSIEITNPEGQAVTIKVTPDTEFRKDRQPAKLSDFKVGDMIFVRGDQNSDNSVTAKMIGGRTGGAMGGPGGPGGRAGGGMMAMGTLGKDYVAGEVKSVDPPKLTVVRTDGVTQTLQLDEQTSLRRGRESITMADIKPGDHIMARGSIQNDVFVPRVVSAMTPEQWQRMQQWMSQSQGNTAKPNGPETTAPKPQE
jgi:Cu/Ag efflux protein CusF